MTGNSIAAMLYAQGQATNNQTLLDLSANVTATCGANKSPLAYLEPAWECANVSVTAYGARGQGACCCCGGGSCVHVAALDEGARRGMHQHARSGLPFAPSTPACRVCHHVVRVSVVAHQRSVAFMHRDAARNTVCEHLTPAPPQNSSAPVPFARPLP